KRDNQHCAGTTSRASAHRSILPLEREYSNDNSADGPCSPVVPFGFVRLPRARRLDAFLREEHRLHERAVAGRVPRREPYPQLAARVERDREVLRAERSQVGG